MPSADAVHRISRHQDDVVTRAQVLALGRSHAWIDRRVGSGTWQRLFPGVFVTHGGPVSWPSRARAALLYAGTGAALSHLAAAYVHQLTPTPPRDLELAVPASRRVRPQAGLTVHPRRRMPLTYGRLLAINPADTTLDLVERATAEEEVVALLCAAVRARTSAGQIRRALERRSRLRERPLVTALLADVADGVESPLEYRYHRDVERRHGLPRSALQVRDRVGGAWIRADGIYVGLSVRVELDGRLAHPRGRTDADTWRDNAVLIERGDLTLRYRWHHVVAAPCATAAQVEAALRSRGWGERARRCGPACGAGGPATRS